MTRVRIFLAALVVLLALPWLFGGERENLGRLARRGLPGQFVKMQDGVTCMEVQGPQPAPFVVFVHGLASPSWVWGDLPGALRERGYATLVYDLYGRGYSDRPWVDYDLDLFDRQLDGLLRRVGLRRPVHVVALSMGGIVAAEFALRHPKAVASLTMIAPAGLRVARPAGLSLLTAPVVGDYLMQVVGDRLLLGGQGRSVHDKELADELALRFGYQLRFAGYKRALLSTMRHMPLADFTARYAELGRRRLPITVFWGRQDEVTPFEGAAVARRLLPRASVHEVGEAGHLIHYEKPDAVIGPLADFLASVEAPPQQVLRDRTGRLVRSPRAAGAAESASREAVGAGEGEHRGGYEGEHEGGKEKAARAGRQPKERGAGASGRRGADRRGEAPAGR